MRIARSNDIKPLVSGHVDDDRAQMLPESSRALWSLWQRDSAGTGTGVPHAGSIDPLRLWPWLGYLIVADLVHGRYRYRVFGSEIAVNAGFDLSGTWMDESLDWETIQLFCQQYESVSAARQALHAEHIRIGAGLRISRLVLPYSRTGDAVDTFIVHYVWSRMPRTEVDVALGRARGQALPGQTKVFLWRPSAPVCRTGKAKLMRTNPRRIRPLRQALRLPT